MGQFQNRRRGKIDIPTTQIHDAKAVIRIENRRLLLSFVNLFPISEMISLWIWKKWGLSHRNIYHKLGLYLFDPQSCMNTYCFKTVWSWAPMKKLNKEMHIWRRRLMLVYCMFIDIYMTCRISVICLCSCFICVVC